MIKELGEKLYKFRVQMNLTQKQVADILEVSPAVISNYEKGERTPSAEMLMSLAVLYRCSTDYLLGINDKHDNSKIIIDISSLGENEKSSLNSLIHWFFSYKN